MSNVIPSLIDYGALRLDGSKAMTGNFNLGSNNIINCAQIGVSGDTDLLQLAAGSLTVSGCIVSKYALSNDDKYLSFVDDSTEKFYIEKYSTSYIRMRSITNLYMDVAYGAGTITYGVNVFQVNSSAASGPIFESYGKDLTFQTRTEVKDIWFKPNEVSVMRVDADGNVYMPTDNSKFIWGAGSDLEMYHNSDDSFINHTNASGGLKIQQAGTTRIETDNTGIGFFATTPVAKQTGCAVPTDLATCITAITVLRTALNAYGLTTVV